MGCTSASSGGDAHGPPAWLPRDKGHAGRARRVQGGQATSQSAGSCQDPISCLVQGAAPRPVNTGGHNTGPQRLQAEVTTAGAAWSSPQLAPQERGCVLMQWPDLPLKK